MATTETARQFHFLREIASGGFGSVFLTKVIHGDGFTRLAAVKLLHPKWSENEEIASRMRDEARLLGWLRHKNIVDVMDLTRIDGRVAVIMEFLEAVDGKIAINHCISTHSRMPVRAALEACAAVASALDAAYNRPPYAGEKPLRVIHRDIKPSNIMIDESGVVKVLDFGVARADFEERESTTREMTFGSVEYMPPERLFFEPETSASDVYSLGVTLYELLSLEKFGKARLRAKEHQEYVDQRLDQLAAARAIPLEEVYDLLGDLLKFDAEERTSAAEAVARMRAAARRLEEPSLEEWSERVIPPLVRAAQSRTATSAPDPLVGRTLFEDARAIATGVPVGPRRSGPDSEPPSLPEITGEDSLDDTGRHVEARWNALKQATLVELSEAGEAPLMGGPPLPPTGLRTMHSRPGLTSPELGPASSRLPPRPSGSHTIDNTVSSLVLPVQRPPPAEEEEGGGGWGLIVGALLGGMLILGIGVVAIVVAVVALVVGTGGLPGASGDPGTEVVAIDAPTEPAKVEDPPPTPPAPKGPSTTFVSKLANPKTIVARCDGAAQEARGDREAVVAGEGLGQCVVTGIDTRRKRVQAVLADVKPGRYVCFESGEKECKPKG